MEICKEGYELLKGSYIYKESKPSFLEHSYYQMRVHYENDGYFEGSNFDDYLVLKKNITFNKSSPAAVIVLNRAANGKTEWKLQDGTSLLEFLSSTKNKISMKSIYQFGSEDRSTKGTAKGAIINDRYSIPVLKTLYDFEIEQPEKIYFSNLEIEDKLKLKVNLEDADKQIHRNELEWQYRIKWTLDLLKNGGCVIKSPSQQKSWKISSHGSEIIEKYDLVFNESIQKNSLSNLQKEIKNKVLTSNKVKIYSWVETHEEITKYLIEQQGDHTELIKLLKSVGIGPFDNDEDENGVKINLTEIDPFTFYFFIYKYGPNRRLKFLQEIASKLGLTIPSDDSGIPSAQAQKLWLFPYKGERKNNEIERLWDFFIAAMNNTANDEQFSDILSIRSTGKTKITEGLFDVDPNKFFPINGPTKPYLKGVFNIDPNFNTFSEYLEILNQIKSKTDKPFYELSFDAWKWNESKDTLVSEPKTPYKMKINNSIPLNQILYGPPGTGKTYALKQNYFHLYTTKETSSERFKFVTFHQSFSYEDFIEGIKPIMPEDGEVAEDLGYKIENGVFKELCNDAKNDPENQYAIFIDEINRGNVSAIFGELITLIETDKRTGCINEIRVTLPYSKEVFSVPKNIDIYGTMNTADRSVEALDTALRRRFSFVEMMPKYDLIDSNEIENINLGGLLKIINDRIEILIDRDHTIGHSYFININTVQELANAFNDKIVPLLQEYFYGDYGKIGLVLGEGFVKEVKTKDIAFATFKYEDSEDFKTPKHEITKVTSENIINAIKTLLGDEDSSEN